jgi:hypothetical protein
MPINVDFMAYHQSIAAELQAMQNRVRNLIGDAHWGEDGAHKEAVFRKVLSTHLAQSYEIGTGFISYEDSPSTQLDVLITNKNKPSLFQNGDIKIVTPDCVEAIVEIKTRQRTKAQLLETLNTLADQVEKVRNFKHPPYSCWAGLFIYEKDEGNLQKWSRILLEALQESSRGDRERAINCVAFGSILFSRFWQHAPFDPGDPDYPSWHSYIFDLDTLRGFSYTYFIGNLVMGINLGQNESVEYAWFPIRGENGKEEYNFQRVSLDNHVQCF